ncbi:MAG: VWA domain-containing protein [Candidatus Riflebacteria bacterium]|nr:VWA domain-containing protein [Candidatus Riflebacteria bacterium]
MLRHLVRLVLVVSCCLGWLAGPVLADGMIIPFEPGDPVRPRVIFRPPEPDQSFTVPLSVTRHRVTVDIKDVAASTKVDQAFYNHLNRTIEGLYIFPLPVGASISGFAMDIEGRMTKGELLDADKARNIYEDIVRQMRDPGLLEFMGTGLFKTRIYPIEGLKEKQVKIEYQEALKTEGNLIRYVYPLNIERFSQEPMKDVSLEIKITSKTPITTIYSPTHSVSIKKHGDNEATIGFEADSVRPDKDFVLYYAVSQKDLSMSLLTHRPDPSEDGTFMLMLSPRSELQMKQAPAIDVALVMDTSGSMAGPKMDQARKSLEYCVNALQKGNRFFLESFATEVDSYKTELVEMDDQVRVGALEYVKRLEPVGGTNISEALLRAVEALKKKGGDRPAFVIFITDGKPTAGLTEPEEILREVKKANDGKIRIFSFGVGDQLNATLLDQLAEQNGGTSDYVGESEDIEAKVSTLFSKLTHPVMTDPSLEIRNVDVSQIYPQRVPDIFKGTNLMITGRYRKPGDALISLSGTIDGQPVKLDYEATFPERETENGFVARIWATRKIGFLLEQIRKSGADQELKDEIVMLAKRYGILTPFTSFLVLEDKEISRGPNLRRAMMPEESLGAPPSPAFEEARSRFSADGLSSKSEGADAVDASREMQAMKAADAPAAAPSMAPGAAGGGYSGRLRAVRGATPAGGLKAPPTKMVGERTFYQLDGKWVDSQVKGEKADLVVKAYSDAYFALLAKHPTLGKFLAVGDRVVLVIDGKTVEISPDSGVTDQGDLF